MIEFEEYYRYLKKQAAISDYFNKQFRALAESSKYLRSNRITKKYQKDLERRRTSSFNILNNIFKEEVKSKGIKAIIVTTEKESKFKMLLKKIFKIKPQAIAGVIEDFATTTVTSSMEVFDKPDIETKASECYSDESNEEDLDIFEEDNDFEDNVTEDDRIEGQMDIEDLNEGVVYEKA